MCEFIYTRNSQTYFRKYSHNNKIKLKDSFRIFLQYCLEIFRRIPSKTLRNTLIWNENNLRWNSRRIHNFSKKIIIIIQSFWWGFHNKFRHQLWFIFGRILLGISGEVIEFTGKLSTVESINLGSFRLGRLRCNQAIIYSRSTENWMCSITSLERV